MDKALCFVQNRPIFLLAGALLCPALLDCLPPKFQALFLLTLGGCFFCLWKGVNWRLSPLLWLVPAFFGLNWIRILYLVPKTPLRTDRPYTCQVQKVLWESEESEQCELIVQIEKGYRVALRAPSEMKHLRSFQSCLEPLPLEGAANPGGFDEKGWLEGQGVFLKAKAKGKPLYSQPRDYWDLTEVRWRLLQRVKERGTSVFGKKNSDFLSALLLGERSQLTEKEKESFQDLNLRHLLSVSGLHFAFMMSTFNSRVFRLINPRARRKLSWAMIFFWSWLSGYPPGFIRAMCYALSRQLCSRIGSRKDPLSVLALSACLLALLNPFSLLDKGTLWSFSATAALFGLKDPLERALRCGKKPKWLRKILSAFCASMAAQTAMILTNLEGMMAFCPGLIATQMVLSALAGILFDLAFPLIVLILFISPNGFFGVLLRGVGIPVSLLTGVWRNFVEKGASLPLIHWGAWRWTPIKLGLWVLLLISFLPPIRRLWRGRGRSPQLLILGVFVCALLFPTLFPAFYFPPRQQVYLSVGEADCGVIRLGDRVVLVDTGLEGTAEKVILPYLRSIGVYQIAAVILTHPHADHYGGCLTLAQLNRIKSVIVPEGFWQPAALGGGEQQEGKELYRNPEEKRTGADSLRELQETLIRNKIPIRVARSGDALRIGEGIQGVVIRFLAASQTTTDPVQDPNERSLVFWTGDEQNRFLWTGDWTPGKENLFCQTDGSKSDRVQVYKVGHHGSRQVTGEDFVRCAKPLASVFSCGPNHYGHPDPNVIHRLKASGSAIFRTDQDGAVVLSWYPKEVIIRTWKTRRKWILRDSIN